MLVHGVEFPLIYKKNQTDVGRVAVAVDEKTNNMYWAINSVKQVGEKAQAWIMDERRKNGPFFSLDEFIDGVDGQASVRLVADV